MISFKNVNKWYGELHVLNNIDLEVKQGEVVVVCGPSGSGKSTLIRCINRLEPIQKGELFVDGYRVCFSILQPLSAHDSTGERDHRTPQSQKNEEGRG